MRLVLMQGLLALVLFIGVADYFHLRLQAVTASLVLVRASQERMETTITERIKVDTDCAETRRTLEEKEASEEKAFAYIDEQAAKLMACRKALEPAP